MYHDGFPAMHAGCGVYVGRRWRCPTFAVCAVKPRSHMTKTEAFRKKRKKKKKSQALVSVLHWMRSISVTTQLRPDWLQAWLTHITLWLDLLWPVDLFYCWPQGKFIFISFSLLQTILFYSESVLCICFSGLFWLFIYWQPWYLLVFLTQKCNKKVWP